MKELKNVIPDQNAAALIEAEMLKTGSSGPYAVVSSMVKELALRRELAKGIEDRDEGRVSPLNIEDIKTESLKRHQRQKK